MTGVDGAGVTGEDGAGVTGVDGTADILMGDVCLGVSAGWIGSVSLGGAVIGACEGATEALVA